MNNNCPLGNSSMIKQNSNEKISKSGLLILLNLTASLWGEFIRLSERIWCFAVTTMRPQWRPRTRSRLGLVRVPVLVRWGGLPAWWPWPRWLVAVGPWSWSSLSCWSSMPAGGGGGGGGDADEAGDDLCQQGSFWGWTEWGQQRHVGHPCWWGHHCYHCVGVIGSPLSLGWCRSGGVGISVVVALVLVGLLSLSC